MKFEDKMKRLEEIAELIKSEDTDFDRQLDLFKEGSVLSADIEKELEKAQQLIEEIQN